MGNQGMDREGGAPAVTSPGEPAGTALPPGSRLAEFEVQRVLGIGGFGVVYLAFDQLLHRHVAIKEYLPAAYAVRRGPEAITALSTQHQETFEAGLKSFMEEARLLARFEHPALVKVLRYWEANGTAYMVMPHYQGRTLRDILKDGAVFGEAELRALIWPLLEALEHLHAEQCYHRDISPENIIVQPSGTPVLLDFGAARRIIGNLTQALTVVLKQNYAPIEQYSDDGGLAQGPWTDIYGVAAVMYTAIVRMPPPSAVARVYQDPLKPLVATAPAGYRARFLRGIDAGLAVRPEDRPRSIAAFREGLGPAADEDADRTVQMPAEALREHGAGPPKAATGGATAVPPKVATGSGVTMPGSGGALEGAAALAKLATGDAAAVRAHLTDATDRIPVVVTSDNRRKPAAQVPGAQRNRLALAVVAAVIAVAAAAGWWTLTQRKAEAPAVATTTVPKEAKAPAEPAPPPPKEATTVAAAPAAATPGAQEAPGATPPAPGIAAPPPAVPLPGAGSPSPAAKATEAVAPPAAAPAAPVSPRADAAPSKADKAAMAKDREKEKAKDKEQEKERAKDKEKAKDREPPRATAALPAPAPAAPPAAAVPSPPKPAASPDADKAAEAGDANKDLSEEARRQRAAAERGETAAQVALGKLYAAGNGAPKSDAEAARWYRRAADQGSAEASVLLGVLYATGRGVAKDPAEAAKWYRKAAEQGSVAAQYNLGLMYAEGNGVPRDEAEAAAWYRKAAEQGNARAQNNLAVMYTNGQGVPRDEAEAARWYRRAAEQGIATAQYNLAVVYASGRGVMKDESEAVNWFRKAAAQGYAPAVERLKALEGGGAK